MKKIVFILSLLFALQSFSQKTSFEWAERSLVMSSAGKLNGQTMLLDPQDNIYLFGKHNDATNASFANGDLIMAKYTPTGQRLWHVKYPTETYAGTSPMKMYWDDNYNIIVIGEMHTIFGTDTLQKYTSSLSPTLGIVKFDSSGNYLWSNQIDADLDDGFDFIQMPNSNLYALRVAQEGTIRYDVDSTLSIYRNDFLAFIDGNNGSLISVKEAPYNLVYPNYLGVTHRKVAAKGNNLIGFNQDYRPINPSVPNFTKKCIVVSEIEWGTADTLSQKVLFINGFGADRYEYDSVNNWVYIFANTSASSLDIDGDSIKNITGTKLVIKYDLNTYSILDYIEFEDLYFEYAYFSYPHGLHAVYSFLDSAKNITTDSSYYPLPVQFTNQYQQLYIAFNNDLSYKYYTQSTKRSGVVNINDMIFNSSGSWYGTTAGGNQFFYDTITLGTAAGNATGCIFKIGGVTGTPTSINEFNEEDKVSVFPNPTNNRLNVISNSIISRVNIIDVNGRLIKQESYKNIIEVADLNNGLYLIQFLDKQNNIIDTKRFIKQ